MPTNVSNNASFRQKYQGVPIGSEGSDRTSYPLMEKYRLPVAYVAPWLCAWKVVTYTHHQNDTSVVWATGPDLDPKNCPVQFLTHPKTWPGASPWAKPVPVHVNPQVLPALATHVSSNLRFLFSGFSIYCSSQICYCYVQNINFGT